MTILATRFAWNVAWQAVDRKIKELCDMSCWTKIALGPSAVTLWLVV